MKREKLRFQSLESRTMLTVFMVEPGDKIQDAIDSAAANPGADTVLIRSGEYEENLEIEDSDSLTIQGIGEVTIKAADSGEDVIDMRDASGDVTLRNLNLSGGERGVDANKKSGAKGGSLTLQRVNIDADEKDALKAEELDSLVVIKSTFQSGDDGMDIEDTSNVRIIQSSVVDTSDACADDPQNCQSVADDGIAIDDADSVLIVGGEYAHAIGEDDEGKPTGEGIDIDSSGRIRVINVDVHDNGKNGLQIEANGETISSVFIAGSTFDNNADDGIEIVANDDGEIENVRLVGNSSNDNGGAGYNIDTDGNVAGAGNTASGNASDTLPG